MRIKSMILTAAAALSFTGAACAASLPEIEHWQNGAARITKLEALSGNKGTWSERDYRTASGTLLHAVLIQGAGAKGWQPRATDAEKGEISGGETAENLTIAGRPALLEYRPVTGRSITVLVDAENVLTLESAFAEKEEITEAAETIVENMK